SRPLKQTELRQNEGEMTYFLAGALVDFKKAVIAVVVVARVTRRAWEIDLGGEGAASRRLDFHMDVGCPVYAVHLAIGIGQVVIVISFLSNCSVNRLLTDSAAAHLYGRANCIETCFFMTRDVCSPVALLPQETRTLPRESIGLLVAWPGPGQSRSLCRQSHF